MQPGFADDRTLIRPEAEHNPATDASHGWHEAAVFYEVIVRSFTDSNRDGIGDLAGLTEKLDYLQWLGVDCLWLPPFYPSPLRDGGYDVADYTDVDPAVGTLDDFADFLGAAHARQIKVIIDFVLNHTSDQHTWFRASRHDPGGPYGDFCVWADDDTGYRVCPSSSRTARPRTGRSTLSASSTTGIASTRTSPT
ncbi:MAG TPA: alpha-amylase family glycosyl hydrolase [Jatrophihabitans sp.]|nr:alpha-amylase family glycosyl hydrolase [Jatrophihabitans sp.]